MSNPLHEQFCRIAITPRLDLSRDIVRVIELRRVRACQIRIWGFTAIATLSLVAIIPAVTELGQQLGQSGFIHYLSIGFSDPGTVSTYWKQFAVTLVEVLPGMSIALVLGTLLILGWSTRNILRQGRRLSLIHIHS
jgi:hypothetical protein